ncbi:hypothetical protein UFOVP1604_307 [uncultured Caudovirales phage]|uniref:Uncharacterized protein n=1 Tax=uncultured Caudovirales phage TaxID=2100421 RepID=A0A6J5SWU9_9CAUD|nr:hypothetical protein UFOVP1604_307 [uncultured Caudovirales phage]
MEILDFRRFKLLLEADEPAPTPPPVEPPAAEITPAPSEPAPLPDENSMPPTDMGVPPTDPFATAELPPDPNAPVPTAGQTGDINIVLIDDDKKWHSKYTGGGGVKRYKEYQVKQVDLDKWITDNQLDSKKVDITDALRGKGFLDKEVYDKLKSAMAAKKLGIDKGDIDIDFDAKLVPSTNQLEVNFIKSKK